MQDYPNYKYRPRRRKNGRKSVTVPGQQTSVSGGQAAAQPQQTSGGGGSKACSRNNLISSDAAAGGSAASNTSNAIKRWTEFNQATNPQVLGRTKVEDDIDEELIEEVGSEDDDDCAKQLNLVTNSSKIGTIFNRPGAGNFCPPGSLAGHPPAALFYTYDDNHHHQHHQQTQQYSNSADMLAGGIQHSMDNNHRAVHNGQANLSRQTPDSSPNSSPYSSVSSAKNYHISNQNSASNNLNTSNYAQDLNSYQLHSRQNGGEFQPSSGHYSVNQISSDGQRQGQMQQSNHQYYPNQPLHHMHSVGNQYAHNPTAAIYANHQPAPPTSVNQNQHNRQSSQNLQQYYPHGFSRHNQQQLANPNGQSINQHQQQQVHSYSPNSQQGASFNNYTENNQHLISVNQHYNQLGNSQQILGQQHLHYNTGGNSAQYQQQFNQQQQHQLSTSVSDINPMRQLYELRPPTSEPMQKVRGSENSNSLDQQAANQTNHEDRSQEEFRTVSNTQQAMQQQMYDDSPSNYNDQASACNLSIAQSQQQVGTLPTSSSASTSSASSVASSASSPHEINGNYTTLRNHSHQQQQSPQQQKMLGGHGNSSPTSAPYDYRGSFAEAGSIVLRTGAVVVHHHGGDGSGHHQTAQQQHQQQQQQHFQLAQDNNHAADASCPRTSPNSNLGPYNLSTSTSSPATMNYNHGQLSNNNRGSSGGGLVSNEYNLTTLQSSARPSPSTQQQNQIAGVTLGVNNQADQKRQDSDRKGSMLLHHGSHDNRAAYQSPADAEQQQQMLHDHHHSQVLTTNMMLLDSNQQPANIKAYTDAYTTSIDSSLMVGLNGQPIDCIVKSFPTPEMSPLDSPGKNGSIGFSQQHYGNSYSSPDDGSETVTAVQNNSISYDTESHEQNGETLTSKSDSGAVNELIARFGDESSVLKSVQPPYKFRMIVSTTVANSLSDYTLQQQLRNDAHSEVTATAGGDQSNCEKLTFEHQERFSNLESSSKVDKHDNNQDETAIQANCELEQQQRSSLMIRDQESSDVNRLQSDNGFDAAFENSNDSSSATVEGNVS